MRANEASILQLIKNASQFSIPIWAPLKTPLTGREKTPV
jgi:hypothetical protein